MSQAPRGGQCDLLCIALSLVVGIAAWPAVAQTKDERFDPVSFDCAGFIRREGSMLEIGERRQGGWVNTEFSCIANSCVYRGQSPSADGTVKEVFRHILIDEGDPSYSSTTVVWQADGAYPELHDTKVTPFESCFSFRPHETLWEIDMGKIFYEDDEIRAFPRLMDYRTDYFHAPESFLGDWSDANAVLFEKKSSDGLYMSAYFEEIYGDVVIRSGSMRASYEIPRHHVDEWREFRISFDDPGWKLSGGANDISEILENVTGFQIRAQWAAGYNKASIRNMRVE